MSESAFKKKVDRCRKKLLPDLINNAAWDHAQYLFRSLLAVAAERNEPVRVISGHLNDEFYGELMDDFKKIKGDLEVLVIEPDTNLEHNRFAQWLQTSATGHLYHATRYIPVPHMLLIGEHGQRFRLEVDHEQTKAVASFNNENLGGMLLGMYKDARQDLLNASDNPITDSPIDQKVPLEA